MQHNFFPTRSVMCALQGFSDVVTVEGGIMHESKASALSTRDSNYIVLVH